MDHKITVWIYNVEVPSRVRKENRAIDKGPFSPGLKSLERNELTSETDINTYQME